MLKDMSEKDFESMYNQEKNIYFQKYTIQKFDTVKDDIRKQFVKDFFKELPKKIQTKVISQYINKEKLSVTNTQKKIKEIFNYLAEKLQIEKVD